MLSACGKRVFHAGSVSNGDVVQVAKSRSSKYVSLFIPTPMDDGKSCRTFTKMNNIHTNNIEVFNQIIL